jgi:hypothetical protein
MTNSRLFPGALILAMIATLLAGGCASTGSDGSGVTTLKQTQMRVEWPMTRFRNADSFGRFSLGQEQQVNQAYAAYKAAFDAALQAANSNNQAPTPDNVQNLANQVIQAIAATGM